MSQQHLPPLTVIPASDLRQGYQMLWMDRMREIESVAHDAPFTCVKLTDRPLLLHFLPHEPVSVELEPFDF